jgi:LPXTG-site transpeptidase (sortase) family protein
MLNRTGKFLVGLGILTGLFIPYELVYTNHLQAVTQATAKREIVKVLPKSIPEIYTTKLPVGPAIPVPTQTQPSVNSWIGLLQIPKINLSMTVIQGTNTRQLRMAPGHYINTAGLGTAGNAAIAGHRTTWGRPFRYLDHLVVNDPIIVTTTQGRFLYRVIDKRVVSPSDLSVLNPSATPILTLTTCNPPYSAVTRLVVVARLAAVDLPKNVAAGPGVPVINPITGKPVRVKSGHPTTTTTTTVPVTLPIAQNVASNTSWGSTWGVALMFGCLIWLLWWAFLRLKGGPWWSSLAMVGIGVVTVPLLLIFYGAVTMILPAGY